MTETDELPFIFDELDRTQHAERIAYHLKSLRLCWPEWDGPKVGGRCEVDSCVVHSITHNERRYHYMAPCVLLKEDGEYWTACVDYADGWCKDTYNGELLRLHITEIWAPVHILRHG